MKKYTKIGNVQEPLFWLENSQFLAVKLLIINPFRCDCDWNYLSNEKWKIQT